MSCPQFIKTICDSSLQHQVHIPDIRSTLYKKSAIAFQTFHEKPNPDNVTVIAERYSTILKKQIQLVEQCYGPEAMKERSIYQQLERVWTLCKVLYFPDASNDNDQQPLMDWFEESYKPYLLEFDRQNIYHCKSTFQHADFWPYAARLVLFGQLDQLSLLFSHVLKDVEFQVKWQLLGYVKDLSDLTGKGIDYVRSHRDSLENIMSGLRVLPKEHHAPPNQHHTTKLMDIVSLLMGDEKVTLQYARDDIHAFVSTRYYQSSTTDVHTAAKEFFTNHNDNGKSDQGMRLFMEGDIHEGLEKSAHYDWWFIAHLADSLNLKKLLDCPLHYTTADGITLTMQARDYFILTYACYLNNHFGLWKEAFTYCMTCDEFGKGVVIELLTRMDFQNDDTKLNEVVKFCINYSMKNSGLVLYEKKASTCLESKQYTRALQYYSKAEKYHYIDQVFNAVLEDYIHTGQLFDIKSFSDTTNDFKGIHYIIYRDISYINSLFLDSKFQLAANTFKSLLRNDAIPNKIMPIVFAEGWKLINRKEYFTALDLLYMKKVWTKFRKSSTPEDFTWYYFYININNQESQDISKDILLRDMTEFFDTTAIYIARAMDNVDKN